MIERKRRTAVDLGRGRRALCAVVGLGALGAGVVAVFETTNQGGTVALVTVGALASILALVGKVPLRWVVAGHEVDMTEEEHVIERTVDAFASEMSPLQLEATSHSLMQMAARSKVATDAEVARYVRVADRLLETSEFEREVELRKKQLLGLFPGWSSAEPDGSTTGGGVDGVLISPSGRRIAIVAKFYTGELTADRVDQIRLQSVKVLENPSYDGILLVLPDGDWTQFNKRRAARGTPVRAIKLVEKIPNLEKWLGELDSATADVPLEHAEER
ncbi:hypothetical protein F0U44_16560 [Nocardioides humilatus]|uniref:Restriction endonuclease type IV Mrr domain-containing protein n=1 Tax=Nocardioides humilatus TaxID=2607660 RepID=A0A5B1L7V0_9ACTN|nr:hypothetical protein [Nocardioides humilatus]KAA1416801.1 hypothetical protein F0U44_16560 [Nocardioides humilatus]